VEQVVTLRQLRRVEQQEMRRPGDQEIKQVRKQKDLLVS
jgi:hypothetical protein